MAAKDAARLAREVESGDRAALARAITLAESTRPDHREAAEALLAALLPCTGRSLRLGITGAPGVGKSTFIEAFGLRWIAAGHKVAVLAIDPSSAKGGGAILGDKTRMAELARADAAFIRPSPAGRMKGGVARRTRESVWLAEAAGYDRVIVETVGVGQAETAVADMVDLFLLLIPPGGGDELQGIKRGVVELADLIIVTKADGDLAPAARRAAADYAHAMRLLRSGTEGPVQVLAVSALEGRGLDAVEAAIARRALALAQGDTLERRRAAQARAALLAELGETLLEALAADAGMARLLAGLEAKVAARALTPGAAARAALAAFRSGAADG